MPHRDGLKMCGVSQAALRLCRAQPDTQSRANGRRGYALERAEIGRSRNPAIQARACLDIPLPAFPWPVLTRSKCRTPTPGAGRRADRGKIHRGEVQTGPDDVAVAQVAAILGTSRLHYQC